MPRPPADHHRPPADQPPPPDGRPPPPPGRPPPPPPLSDDVLRDFGAGVRRLYARLPAEERAHVDATLLRMHARMHRLDRMVAEAVLRAAVAEAVAEAGAGAEAETEAGLAEPAVLAEPRGVADLATFAVPLPGVLRRLHALTPARCELRLGAVALLSPADVAARHAEAGRRGRVVVVFAAERGGGLGGDGSREYAVDADTGRVEVRDPGAAAARELPLHVDELLCDWATAEWRRRREAASAGGGE